MPFTSTVTVFRYGSQRYGNTLYGGLTGPNIGASVRNVTGIVFITSNDRYQVVVCSASGAQGIAPEFRYWYGAPPTWGEELNGAPFLPPFWAANEDDSVPVGSLETPYRLLKSPQEALIKGVLVEFVPRPASLTVDQLPSTATISFTAKVEGQGVPAYARDTALGASGIVVSDEKDFSEAASSQANEPWPNIRTEFLPCRLGTRVRSARVVLTNISLVEVISITLVGATDVPGRTR